MKPIIGITVECHADPEDARSGGNLKLNWNYAQVIADAGGVPVLIPPVADMDALAEIIDGWLIPGGADIDARYFGEENHPKVELGDPARFESESRLYRAIDPNLPVLGICYGCQFLNVARGGSLEQHLPDRVHHHEHTGGTRQSYQIEASRLRDVFGSGEVAGKSYHHQAVGRLGEGLRIVGKHEDGTVEAIEAVDRPWVMAVQWHPERTADETASQRLFQDFIRAAREYAGKKREGLEAVGAA